MELYGERGFESTSVAEIAKRAGLTERTFFRHFADKREVLFAGAGEFQALLVRGVDEAPPSLPPLEAIVTALVRVSAAFFDDRRELVRFRQAIITQNAELQERELIKLAAVAAAFATALRRRGVPDPAASLAAEAGTAVFKIAFEAWVSDDGHRTLSQVIGESAAQLRAVAGGQAPAPAD
jgi:AcrR family transcriptional regulator